MLIDADHGEKSYSCDVCIIGSGPAGSSLAFELTKSGFNVIVAESGGKLSEPERNNRNDIIYTSNFTFRKNFINRHRQVGGTANLWAGRVVPFEFDAGLDTEWGNLPAKVEGFKAEANHILGVSDKLVKKYFSKGRDLVAYWGKKNERFNAGSAYADAGYRIIYHLTFTGKTEGEQGQFTDLSFYNTQQEIIGVKARTYVLATGGIENSRLLLLMEDKLKPAMGNNFDNVGRYFMEHPKITHGDVIPQKPSDNTLDYELHIVPDGKVKTGVRNVPVNGVRVYANLVGGKSAIVRKLYAKAANVYKFFTKKVYYAKQSGNKKTDEIKDLIYLVEPEELIPHSLLHFFSKFSFIKSKPKKVKIITYLEQLPEANNRVILNGERKDEFGLPVPELQLTLSAKEIEAVVAFYKELTEYFKEKKAKLVYHEKALVNPANYTEASHHIGGTRYSADISRAVVDEELKVIGTDNLFMAGCSVFPTSGIENPTYLIVCLSCYLASVIKEKLAAPVKTVSTV